MSSIKRKEIPVNGYGNIDIQAGVPAGLVHVSGKRLTVTCRAIGIECAPALVGWDTSSRWPKPIIDGVVIFRKDKKKLEAAIEKRDANRATPEQREIRRQKAQEKAVTEFTERIRADYPSMPRADVEQCAVHATEIGSGRVGRSTTSNDPVRAAVVAYVRHEYTDYDDLLCFDHDKELARAQVAEQIGTILSVWEKDK